MANAVHVEGEGAVHIQLLVLAGLDRRAACEQGVHQLLGLVLPVGAAEDGKGAGVRLLQWGRQHKGVHPGMVPLLLLAETHRRDLNLDPFPEEQALQARNRGHVRQVQRAHLHGAGVELHLRATPHDIEAVVQRDADVRTNPIDMRRSRNLALLWVGVGDLEEQVVADVDRSCGRRVEERVTNALDRERKIVDHHRLVGTKNSPNEPGRSAPKALVVRELRLQELDKLQRPIRDRCDARLLVVGNRLVPLVATLMGGRAVLELRIRRHVVEPLQPLGPRHGHELPPREQEVERVPKEATLSPMGAHPIMEAAPVVIETSRHITSPDLRRDQRFPSSASAKL